MTSFPTLPARARPFPVLPAAPVGHPAVAVDPAFRREGRLWFDGDQRARDVIGTLIENPVRDEDTVGEGGSLSFTISRIEDRRPRVLFAFRRPDGVEEFFVPTARTDTRGGIGGEVEWSTERYNLRLLNPDNAGDLELINASRGTPAGG